MPESVEESFISVAFELDLEDDLEFPNEEEESREDQPRKPQKCRRVERVQRTFQKIVRRSEQQH